ncbi:mechanosensitive ion channel family protein [Pseudotabrizicola sp. L79]|uniref:mechanosensitive ion channel family protein n=1 Tax=Pseudotabrizicola sp. L79 TaxID=3118402 RepID=UPI002F943AB4
MDLIDPQVIASAEQVLKQLQGFFLSLLQPFRLWQVVIVIGVFALAHVLARLLAPRVDDWARSHTELKPWQARTIITLRKRLRGILFVVLAWAAVVVISMINPFPSRRYIVELAATIGTAWVVIGLVTKLIRNRFLRRMVTWGAWVYVTVLYLGFLDTFTQFLDSIAITFGDFRLSALTVTKALVVTGALVTAARLLTTGAANRIRRNDDISPSVQVLAVKLMQISAYGAAFFIGLKAVGFDLTGLAVLSGAIGVGLGFGLQKVVSNLVSGMIILLDKSIKPGDVISIGDTFGWIESLGARYVSVVTRDGKEYLIPNEDLITGQVVNWSHSNNFVRIEIAFGTSYHDDPYLVRRVAVAAAESVERVLRTKPAVCHVAGFGDSSVDYVLRFWITDPTEGLANIRSEVFLALWDGFKENGISIPFPQREVRVLNDQIRVERPEDAGSLA